MKTEQTTVRAKTPQEALGVIRSVTKIVPQAAIVLGSGVSALNDLIEPHVFPYEEIFGIAPGWPGTPEH